MLVKIAQLPSGKGWSVFWWQPILNWIENCWCCSRVWLSHKHNIVDSHTRQRPVPVINPSAVLPVNWPSLKENRTNTAHLFHMHNINHMTLALYWMFGKSICYAHEQKLKMALFIWINKDLLWDINVINLLYGFFTEISCVVCHTGLEGYVVE